jgi:hypothetical protein
MENREKYLTVGRIEQLILRKSRCLVENFGV